MRRVSLSKFLSNYSTKHVKQNLAECNEYTDLIAQCKPHKPMIRGGEVTFKKSYKCNAVIGMIANGVKAKPGEFPHMAALGVKTDEGVKFVCGGSLISENFVLSAAHCFASG